MPRPRGRRHPQLNIFQQHQNPLRSPDGGHLGTKARAPILLHTFDYS